MDISLFTMCVENKTKKLNQYCCQKYTPLKIKNLKQGVFIKNLSQITFTSSDLSRHSLEKKYNNNDDIYIGKIDSPITELSQQARTKRIGKNLDLSSKDFTNYIFTKSNFHKTNFSNSTFNNTDLSQCDLTETIFDNSKLEFTDFSKSNLTDASFKNANLNKRIDFVGATLFGVDFSDTDLKYANLTNTTIVNCNFTDAVYDKQSRFPKEFNPKKEGMILKESNNENGSVYENKL